MTAWTFWGTFLTAFGAPSAMFIFTIAPDPVRIILLVLSSFFWLISLLISSLWWFAVVPLRHEPVFGLVFSVAFQEIFRILLYLLLFKARSFMSKLTENDPIFGDKPHILAYVLGFGFGISSGLFGLVNVLADSLGPGTLGIKGGDFGVSRHFFIFSALFSLAIVLCHTAWGVIAFSACEEKKYLRLVTVWAMHYALSGISLLNQSQLYALTLITTYLILTSSIAMAFFIAGGSVNSLKACFALRNGDSSTNVFVR
ncbi:gamma-secretase subunit Aph-1 [Lepeophtheirus salmonis]|uniref:Anterior pharynx defective 1 CG2855PAlike [Tribolium castaneum] n=1 Tax=Lepeophtheirus salmonis TaxID=72036 RepID=D3PK49_LEPSM|nr:gamma-secretase subunit Aph-1-like [Lepeophtheirus salmonis]ADD38935.1 Gamma-secretase subunit Aph-1 [Lepeophtheirus salmonis]